MVWEQNANRGRTFPSAEQSVQFGLSLCRSGFFAIATFNAFGVLAVLALRMVQSRLPDDAAWYVTAPVWVAARMAILFASVAALRRGLDYWDEMNGRARRRDYSAAVGNAFAVAVRRLLPWLGYTALGGVAVFVASLPFRFVVQADLSFAVRALAVTVTLVLAVGVAIVLNFVPVAAADGPGDAIARSWIVVRLNLWRVLGTLVFLAMVAALAFVPLLVIRSLLSDSWAWISVALLIVYILGVQAVAIGTMVSMYRGQFSPR